VSLVESPPTFGSCQPPISTVNSVPTGQEGADVTVANGTTQRAREFLTFMLTSAGQVRYFWTPIDLRPGTSIRFHVHYVTTVDLPIIAACAQKPVGIVDGQEPVLIVVDIPPDQP